VVFVASGEIAFLSVAALLGESLTLLPRINQTLHILKGLPPAGFLPDVQFHLFNLLHGHPGRSGLKKIGDCL